MISCIPKEVDVSKVFRWLMGSFNCFSVQTLGGRPLSRRHCCHGCVLPLSQGKVLRRTERDGGSMEVIWRYFHDGGNLGTIDLKILKIR